MRGTHVCGCYRYLPESRTRTYLPQVKLDAHTTILSTASRTVLRQTFVNHSNEWLQEIRYAFPLYDGVSVVDFCCQVGGRTIYGLVKEKNQAKETYEEAKRRGENAALLEQLPDAADVFTTTISNIPGGASVHVIVKYVQELKHDAEVDGVRLTIPTTIAPRYGTHPRVLKKDSELMVPKGISLTVDIIMVEGIPIKKIISPSHPVQITLGSLSSSTIDEHLSLSRGSATLVLDTSGLEKDFVLQVVAKDVGAPQAILETHPTLPNQRALMATLVPKFNLKSEKPEIILVADRSGSMQGANMWTLKDALKVFLKSIPVGCTFNICSFGSRHEFLWHESQAYDEDRLVEAIQYVETFEADFGGTETLAAIEGCFRIRNTDNPTELILLTDGDIWAQKQLFEYVTRETMSGDVRIFPLGIGSGVSSTLIEGVARAGRGFAQMVENHERMDSKIVRMLKGALTPHINDYSLEVKYEDDSVDTVADSLRVRLKINNSDDHSEDKAQTLVKPISLYDPDAKEERLDEVEPEDLFASLPDLKRPTLLQTPHEIPALFPFHRTCVYLLMAPESSHLKPKSVILRGTCPQGPLELEIPVGLHKDRDEMIHQLAARKAIQELEEGNGWISNATLDDTGALLRKKHAGIYSLLQRREAVRLGVEFQVGGKYCSFVAVEANETEIMEKRQKAIQAMNNPQATSKDEEEDEDWEVVRNPAQEVPGQSRKRTAALASFNSGPMPNTFSRAASYAPSARGGGGMSSSAVRSGRGGNRSGVFARRMAPSASSTMFQAEVDEEKEESDEDMGYGLFDGDNSADSKSNQKSESLLRRLIGQQSFSGPWPALSSLPCAEMGVDAGAAASAAKKLVDNNTAADASTAERILATVLVVSFLESKMVDEKETWELVVEKARTWLQDTVEDDAALVEVWGVAAGLVGA